MALLEKVLSLGNMLSQAKEISRAIRLSFPLAVGLT